MVDHEETLGRTLAEIRDLLEKILSSLGGAKNADNWDHDHCTIGEPGTPKRLPPMKIPNGMEVVVRALPKNTGSVYIGRSKQMVLNPDKRIELAPKDYTRLRVSDTSLIWVDADNPDEGIDFWCETT